MRTVISNHINYENMFKNILSFKKCLYEVTFSIFDNSLFSSAPDQSISTQVALVAHFEWVWVSPPNHWNSKRCSKFILKWVVLAAKFPVIFHPPPAGLETRLIYFLIDAPNKMSHRHLRPSGNAWIFPHLIFRLQVRTDDLWSMMNSLMWSIHKRVLLFGHKSLPGHCV